MRRGGRGTRLLPQTPPEPGRGLRPGLERFRFRSDAVPRKRKLCCKSKKLRQPARCSLTTSSSNETPRACGDSRLSSRQPRALARRAEPLGEAAAATPPNLESPEPESKFYRCARSG